MKDIAVGVPSLTDHDSRATLDGSGGRCGAPADTDAVVAIPNAVAR